MTRLRFQPRVIQTLERRIERDRKEIQNAAKEVQQ
jgi:hypothetical protein